MYSRARACSSQKPSFTQSQKKHISQNFGSRSSQRELPIRRQWWQSTAWSESSSSSVSFLDSRTASVSVWTTMPSRTFVAQACWKVLAPSTSTTHMRQLALGSSSFRKHRVGMRIPLARAASSTLVPAGTDRLLPSMMMFTFAMFMPPSRSSRRSLRGTVSARS